MTAEDRFAIEQQIYRYAYAWDTGDVDGFLNVFTEDLVGDGVMAGEKELFSHIQGADQMRAFFESGHNGDAGSGLHHTSTVLFDELTPESAQTRSMVIVTRQTPDGPLIATHGVYHDQWCKRADGWRIQRRLYEAQGYRAPRRPNELDERVPAADDD